MFKTKEDADKVLEMKTLKMGEDEVTLFNMFADLFSHIFLYFS